MVKDLMATAKQYYIYPGKSARRTRLIGLWVSYTYLHPGFAFVAYPNRDSTPYKERYNIPEAETILRGVSILRFPRLASGKGWKFFPIEQC